MWPYVVPPELTIWDAAAPERSQVFMLTGVAITMPLVIGYTARAYRAFRGKVGHGGNQRWLCLLTAAPVDRCGCSSSE